MLLVALTQRTERPPTPSAVTTPRGFRGLGPLSRYDERPRSALLRQEALRCSWTPTGPREARSSRCVCRTMRTLPAPADCHLRDCGSATGSDGDSAQDPSQPWQELAADYERARAREDSLDRLVEWPAERDVLGDVTGHSILDLGCGNGGKLAETRPRWRTRLHRCRHRGKLHHPADRCRTDSG